MMVLDSGYFLDHPVEVIVRSQNDLKLSSSPTQA